MKTLFRNPGVPGLLCAQSQVAFNDNAAKLLLIGLVQILLPADEASRLVSAIALLLVAPFVLFAPLGGWLADHFPKRQVLAASLWLQLGVTIALATALCLHSIPLAVSGFFLLGIQSALMAPARRGIAKELAPEAVGELVGWMEMLCIVAILLGSIIGGQLIDGFTAALANAWTAALLAFGFLALGCLASIFCFRGVPTQNAANEGSFTGKSLFGHRDLLRSLRRDRGIWRAALGDSVFYLAGGVLLLVFAEIGRALYPDGLGAARATGMMFALMGLGVAGGSLIAARLSRHGINLGLAPCGALGMAATLMVLAAIVPGSPVFYLVLVLLGLAGGVYIVPLGAFLVDRAPERERGKILAASGLLSSVAGVLAVAFYAVATDIFHLGVAGKLLLLAALMLATSGLAARLLPQHLLRLVALALARVRYSVKRVGEIPSTGGVLLVCNHVSYVDTLILSLAVPRPIRFLSYESYSKTPVLGPILRMADTIPVSSTRAKEAITRAAASLQQGEVVCIFPEGQLTRTGSLMELKNGFELIARRAKCPIVVAQLDGLWGSIFSFEGGRYFRKLPRGLRRQATVSFSAPFDRISRCRVRELMLELGEAAFRHRRVRVQSLGGSLVQALKSGPFKACVYDQSSPKKQLRKIELLALSWRLSARWRKMCPEERIGVILPPGIGGSLANVSLLLAGKIPVNLNPTLSEEAARSCLEQAGVTTILSAEAVRRKFSNFPWPRRMVALDQELAGLTKLELVCAFAQVFLLPWRGLQARMGLNRSCPNREAALLFTSGSSGLPKGVPLTHANLLANSEQIAATSFLQEKDRLLSALPLFHSFGLTMGLFFPLLAGRVVLTAPSPLDGKALAAAARHGAATILLSTPTFLRNYTKRIPAEAFGSLRLAVAGAERLPAETVAAFRDRFGCPVLEGYGLTEASPVVSLNVPNPPCRRGGDSRQIGSREGSVGRLLPGVALRIFDPETLEPALSRGLLALRGPNLISGYLRNADAEKFQDGWFATGDIVRVDPEGFLFIEGRSSRFSKIGGEMVSHAAVETALATVLPDGEEQDCVLGLPCLEKGERLVLLTTRELSREKLRQLLSGPVPNLWIPREVIRLPRLPMLASGKLNLAECCQVASRNSGALGELGRGSAKSAVDAAAREGLIAGDEH